MGGRDRPRPALLARTILLLGLLRSHPSAPSARSVCCRASLRQGRAAWGARNESSERSDLKDSRYLGLKNDCLCDAQSATLLGAVLGVPRGASAVCPLAQAPAF